MTSGEARITDADQGFLDWLNDDFPFHVAVKYEHRQWFALMMEFDITGCGETRASAVEQAFELLTDYLLSFYAAGQPFGAAVRPIPRGLRTRIMVESAIGRTMRRLTPRSTQPLVSESTYALPPGLLHRYAH